MSGCHSAGDTFENALANAHYIRGFL
ncbi:type II toxin-antitoxin system HicB family antitoxin [Halomonas sp. 707B3]|nr:type II toxin-antitoxin system HicB family antitoxin [Halomonas lionensis]MCP1318607.1 type II toxin-antitoxin system HicB family antitoxin [Halomonas sp. 707B3]